LPAEPFTAAFGVTRSVGESVPVVQFEGGEYSAPDDYIGQDVWLRQQDDEIVIVHVARSDAVLPSAQDERQPAQPGHPERAAKVHQQAALLALDRLARHLETRQGTTRASYMQRLYAHLNRTSTQAAIAIATHVGIVGHAPAPTARLCAGCTRQDRSKEADVRGLPHSPPKSMHARLERASHTRLHVQPRMRHAFVAGCVAAVVAGEVMLLLRAAIQVRSVPERLEEGVLLVLPLDVFTAGLQWFGFDAKRYGLYAACAAVLAVLVGVGTMAMHKRWRPLKLGLGLWFVAMVALLPLTGAGFFASDLFDKRWAAVVGYLGVALAYAACLGWWTSALAGQSADAGRRPGRRAAVRLLGGAAIALAFAPLGEGAKVRPPVRRLEVPAAPEIDVSVGLNAEAGALFAESTGSSAAIPAAVPEAPPIPVWPEPPPPRRLKRDINGATLPAGRRAGELTELVTSNDDFYVVSKNAAGDPIQAAEHWRLRIQGEVVEAIELDYIGLRSLPSVEVTKTLECISNLASECQLAPFGCDLISSARWTGVRLSDVLHLAGGAGPRATSLMVVSADEYTTSLPLEVALDPDTLLVYEMNGQVLPREHGYPIRLLVPGRYGMKNPKWVVGLRLLAGDTPDWYGQRNWSQQGFVRTMTRIDVPAPGARLTPGEYNVAGIAYAGDRGIQQVEFSVDGGSTWELAELLEPPAGRDVWVRWLGTFILDVDGPVSILARATDGDGTLQPEAFSLPQPDGSAGWPSVEVHPKNA